MKLQLKTKKLTIHKVNGFWERFKTLKFNLSILKDGIVFEKKKYLSTYFFCQKVDVIMTDIDQKILYMYEAIRSEKIIFYKRKVYYTYILPLNSCKDFEIGQTLPIINK